MSYTFFKPLDLSRSNGQKKTLINVNILINISLIILYLLHSIPISKPKKTQKSISLFFFSHCFSKKKKKISPLHASLSLSPPLLFPLHRQVAGKKKKPLVAQLVSLPLFFSVVIISQIELFYCILYLSLNLKKHKKVYVSL